MNSRDNFYCCRMERYRSSLLYETQLFFIFVVPARYSSLNPRTFVTFIETITKSKTPRPIFFQEATK